MTQTPTPTPATPAPLKGMIVSVFRDARLGDCTNGGVTATANEVLLVGPDIPEIFEAADLPVLLYVERTIGGKPAPYAMPIAGPVGQAGPMFGGNFVWSSDSRFPTAAPLKVHDRFETWEQYNRLST